MKATRKLIPAIALLLVSVVLLSTASFAWFTTNKTVNASMTVSVTTPQNLMISTDGSTWSNAVNLTKNSEYAKLTPVSSADGQKFVLGSGLQLETEGVLDSTALDAILADSKLGTFSEVSGPKSEENGEVYYITNTFQLRASQDIKKPTSKVSCNVSVTSTETGTEAYLKALRVFILQKIDESTYKVVVSACGEGNFNECYPIVNEGTVEQPQFTVSSDAVTAVNDFTSAEIAFEAAVAQEFTIVVWLEGNDPACVSSNIDGKPDCNISVDFKVEDIDD